MKTKTEKIIIIGAILLVTLGTAMTIFLFEKSNSRSNNHNSVSTEIKLFGKQYDSLSAITADDLENYLSWVALVFKGKTYNSFTNADITILVAYKYLVLYGEGYGETKVQKFVQELFGVNNFVLKEGTYISPIFAHEEIIITKKDGTFVSNLVGKSAVDANFYRSKEVNNEQIIVHYERGSHNLNTGEFSLIGKTDIYLKYNGTNLVLEKIIYTEK